MKEEEEGVHGKMTRPLRPTGPWVWLLHACSSVCVHACVNACVCVCGWEQGGAGMIGRRNDVRLGKWEG